MGRPQTPAQSRVYIVSGTIVSVEVWKNGEWVDTTFEQINVDDDPPYTWGGGIEVSEPAYNPFHLE